MPLAWSDDPADKMEGQKGVTITDLELYEISAVAIPANRDAIARMKTASLGVLTDISGYSWAKDLTQPENIEEPEATALLIDLSDEEILFEASKRLDEILSDEVPEGMAKHLDCLRIQLLPILGQPPLCNHSDNAPSLLDNLGILDALNKVRNCS